MKRIRSDSITAAVRATAAAQLGPLDPPAYVALRRGDRPFWDGIVRARPRDTWNESDLVAAANLARCRADIERLQAEIDDEGDVLTNDRGTSIMNPKHALLEVLSRRSLALSKALHVHAEATVGNSRDSVKAAQAQQAATEMIARHDDDLIPRLRAN
jgi:hypothetical protein